MILIDKAIWILCTLDMVIILLISLVDKQLGKMDKQKSDSRL
ncbi:MULTISPECIES: hypothetical protein [Sphingobacterium]|nr:MULTISPECIES: hypothetical protein [Sphingobacterium]